MKKKLPFFLALIISVPIITLIVFLLAGVKADNANVADGESYMAALKDADINKIEHKINENRQTGSSTEPVTTAPTEPVTDSATTAPTNPPETKPAGTGDFSYSNIGCYIPYSVDADKANAAADSFDGSSASYRTVFGNAAFVGDSVMTGFDVYMGLPNNVNVFAEVGAFMDKHLPAVIDSVIARYPKYVFIRYGINEMGTTTAEADAFASRYKGYIQKLKNNLPDAKIVVLGIAPVGNAAVAKNTRFGMINEYNTRIKAFCQEIGVAYYENSELFISNASLYSKDGIHFSKELYQKWVKDIIRKVGVY
uniref:GDSL-type esterase/lipase family protein n=1 Tax=Eshraghiella crossota TaxID=45851 RepID=UPI004024E805